MESRPDMPRTTSDYPQNSDSSSFQGAVSTDGISRAVFEAPDGPLFSAIRRSWLVVLGLAIVCAALGVGLGIARKASSDAYTASATIQVGQVNPNSPGFYGYVQSSAALATAFSRAIEAEAVVDAVQH